MRVDMIEDNNNHTRPFKKTRRNRNIGRLEVDAWVNEQGYLSVNKKDFKNLSTEDYQFVIAYNTKI
eukprot:8734936-Ditylum_brightwellii.AAC.1